jgi:hypothetical protein
MHPMKGRLAYPPCHPVAAEPGGEQLPDRDDTVLSTGNPGDLVVNRSHFVAHTATKADQI